MDIKTVTYWFDHGVLESELWTKVSYYFGYWAEILYKKYYDLLHLLLLVFTCLIFEILFFWILAVFLDRGDANE